MTTHEFRVSWRREGWRRSTKDHCRLFARRCDAERFIAEKLLGDARPHLSPIIITRTCRTVGVWLEGWQA